VQWAVVDTAVLRTAMRRVVRTHPWRVRGCCGSGSTELAVHRARRWPSRWWLGGLVCGRRQRFDGGGAASQ
jgi:hypothetical protein